jgi:DNA-binding CsgD family transcriptional regulator
MICDDKGGLRYVNRAAKAELDNGRLLAHCGETVRCFGNAAAAFDLALRQAALKGRRQLVTLTAGSDLLLVSVVPLSMSACELPLVVITLGRRRACSELGLELFANAYRLTLAERRVLHQLVQERSPKDIASAHSVAISTVRTQIASLRTKLGVASVDALLLRTAQIPPVASALRLSPVHQGRAVQLQRRDASLMAA